MGGVVGVLLDGGFVDWFADLIAGRGADGAGGLVEVEDVLGPWLSDEVADSLGMGFGVGDGVFVLEVEEIDIREFAPGVHHALVVGVVTT